MFVNIDFVIYLYTTMVTIWCLIYFNYNIILRMSHWFSSDPILIIYWTTLERVPYLSNSASCTVIPSVWKHGYYFTYGRSYICIKLLLFPDTFAIWTVNIFRVSLVLSLSWRPASMLGSFIGVLNDSIFISLFKYVSKIYLELNIYWWLLFLYLLQKPCRWTYHEYWDWNIGKYRFVFFYEVSVHGRYIWPWLKSNDIVLQV